MRVIPSGYKPSRLKLGLSGVLLVLVATASLSMSALTASAAPTSVVPEASTFTTNGVGNAVEYGITTGVSDPGFPAVAGGEARAAVPDGHGGWFIGGWFTSVGGLPRNGLAHVLANNTVDPNFAPSVDSNEVMSLARVGNTLYVGGNFGSISHVDRPCAAALNTTNGAVKPWNPRVNSTVWAVRPSGRGIFLGGWFNEVGSTASARVIEVDPTTGANLGWPGVENSFVRDVQVAAGSVFVASEYGVDAYDQSTGALRWHAETRDARSLSLDGSKLYIGGSFSTFAGQPRSGLAAVNANDGSLLSWTARTSNTVNSVLATRAGVVVGGFFETVNGEERGGVALLNGSTGALSSWESHLNGTVWGLAVSPTSVLVLGAMHPSYESSDPAGPGTGTPDDCQGVKNEVCASTTTPPLVGSATPAVPTRNWLTHPRNVRTAGGSALKLVVRAKAAGKLKVTIRTARQGFIRRTVKHIKAGTQQLIINIRKHGHALESGNYAASITAPDGTELTVRFTVR